MKVLLALITLMLVPALAVAANPGAANGQSTGSSSTTSSDDATSTATSSTTSNQSEDSQLQTENRVQTSNPGTGTMTQAQMEERAQEQIEESKSAYSPKNSEALLRLSAVSTAAENLIRVSNRISNESVGTQIRTIAEEQIENQDKINQAIDKADSRSAFAKFFTGSNFSQLKEAKKVMVQNQVQVRELQQLMEQVTSEADKLEIANQIMTLQEESIALRDQLDEADDGFSLFGWLARWIAGY